MERNVDGSDSILGVDQEALVNVSFHAFARHVVETHHTVARTNQLAVL